MGFRDEVRAMESPYKFGGSRRAAMCWIITLDGGEDESDGSTEAPTGYFARIGRTILMVDDRGFVIADRYVDEATAHDVFDRLQYDYSGWVGDDE